MARQVTLNRRLVNSALAWGFGLLIFFPILWTILTSFKTEAEAISRSPSLFGFDWTMENYEEVNSRANYPRYFMNSMILAFGSVILGLIIAVPAAWSMAFVPSKRTRGILMWMLSTKMLPPVGVLIPIYLLFQKFGLLDSRIGLVFVLTMVNLPIIVWMLFTYFREIPGEILEAARMDGASPEERDPVRAHADGAAGHRLDDAPEHHPRLERGLLDAGADDHERRPPDPVHRELLEPRRAVLREALGRLDDGDRAGADPGLVQPRSSSCAA